MDKLHSFAALYIYILLPEYYTTRLYNAQKALQQKCWNPFLRPHKMVIRFETKPTRLGSHLLTLLMVVLHTFQMH